jgi:hypothetical protein
MDVIVELLDTYTRVSDSAHSNECTCDSCTAPSSKMWRNACAVHSFIYSLVPMWRVVGRTWNINEKGYIVKRDANEKNNYAPLQPR